MYFYCTLRVGLATGDGLVICEFEHPFRDGTTYVPAGLALLLPGPTTGATLVGTVTDRDTVTVLVGRQQ